MHREDVFQWFAENHGGDVNWATHDVLSLAGYRVQPLDVVFWGFNVEFTKQNDSFDDDFTGLRFASVFAFEGGPPTEFIESFNYDFQFYKLVPRDGMVCLVMDSWEPSSQLQVERLHQLYHLYRVAIGLVETAAGL